ncbi:hypothetical protein Gpo141_00008677 [Globisporangium polare]
MARSRRSAPASPARKAPAATPAKAPAPVTAPSSAPTPAPVQSSSGGMIGGLLGTVAEGMAFGTGSAIARHAVNSVVDSLGSSGKDQPQQQQAAAPAAPIAAAAPVCVNDQKAFMECLNTKMNDISACQFYLDALNQCKQQSAWQ